MLTIPMMHKAKVGAAENAPRVLACPRQLHCAILLVANLTSAICPFLFVFYLTCVQCKFNCSVCASTVLANFLVLPVCVLCAMQSCARLPLWLQ